MYYFIIPCSPSHVIVPKYCHVGASLAIFKNLMKSESKFSEACTQILAKIVNHVTKFLSLTVKKFDFLMTSGDYQNVSAANLAALGLVRFCFFNMCNA